MGPKAFQFYIHAALSYLCGPDSDGDSDAVSSFCGLIEFRLEHECEAVMSVASQLRKGIEEILREFGRYDCDMDIYGDVASRYEALFRTLNA
jgi:hypothetical protein